MRALVVAVLAGGLCACSTTPYDLGRKQNGAPLTFSGDKQTPITELDPSAVVDREGLNAIKASELTESLLARSDVYCNNYLTGISILNNGVTSSLDITALTLSSVVPLTTPTANKNILSAIAAIATGSKTALTNDILGGKEYGLIHDAIVNGRRDERKVIEGKIAHRDFEGWSAEAILSQIQPYHADCGIEFGLQYLRASVAKQSQATTSESVPADIASAAKSKAKSAASQSASRSKSAVVASLKAAKTAEQAKAKAKTASVAQTDQKAKAVSDASSSAALASSAQKIATSLAEAEAAAKLAADDWADASAKADTAAIAYAAAEAQTMISDEAAKQSDDLITSFDESKPPQKKS